MDTVESMRAFVRVVELGGFAPAARTLGISAGMVAKHVAHLEQRTGARLLDRTTRLVRPTDAGRRYHERCLSLLAGIEEAEALAGAEARELRGTLRVTAPTEFGNRHLAPLATSFLMAHPGLDLLLDFSNRVVDLVQEGFDLAFRVAPSLDTALVGRRLATSRFHVVASPDFLARHGRPEAPSRLADLPALAFSVPAMRDEWPFTRDGQQFRVAVRPRLVSSSSEALRLAARSGAGVSWLPSFVCGEDIADGSLVSLFPDHDAGSLGIWGLFPHRRLMPGRVRAFLDFVAEELGGDPAADPFEPPCEAAGATRMTHDAAPGLAP